eukprot:1190586-Prorocentrum_minimum.AAC.3
MDKIGCQGFPRPRVGVTETFLSKCKKYVWRSTRNATGIEFQHQTARGCTVSSGADTDIAFARQVGDVVEVGQSREFLIINNNDSEGSLTLSLRRMQRRSDSVTGGTKQRSVQRRCSVNALVFQT